MIVWPPNPPATDGVHPCLRVYTISSAEHCAVNISCLWFLDPKNNPMDAPRIVGLLRYVASLLPGESCQVEMNHPTSGRAYMYTVTRKV